MTTDDIWRSSHFVVFGHPVADERWHDQCGDDDADHHQYTTARGSHRRADPRRGGAVHRAGHRPPAPPPTPAPPPAPTTVNTPCNRPRSSSDATCCRIVDRNAADTMSAV